jgi:hypothetical protein
MVAQHRLFKTHGNKGEIMRATEASRDRRMTAYDPSPNNPRIVAVLEARARLEAAFG